MQGLMMDYELTLTQLLERAANLFPNKEIVTRSVDGLERRNYLEIIERTGKLAGALHKLGIQSGDRVATLAWNHSRHLELYLAVPCMGAVLHPLNIRLPVEHLVYIINHAEDKVLFVDASLFPLVEKLAPYIPNVRQVVVMGAPSPAGAIPASPFPASASFPGLLDYETLIAAESPNYPWPALKENDAAAMCYTSGTTGRPKGALYSHRSMFLHTLGLSMVDSIAMSEQDVYMPIVPMFHVLAWGMPYACVMLGSKIVFPGPFMTPADLAGLIQSERVTKAAGVPTIWIGFLNLLEKQTFDISSLKEVVSGGAATPRAVIETFARKYNVNVIHAWGMTETSPLGTTSRLRSDQESLSEDERLGLQTRQGSPVPGIHIRAIDEYGRPVPWNGQAYGELQVRGAWVIGSYYNDESTAEAFDEGWFKTGDVVTIDSQGSMLIIDRKKDLIRSGGEWIPSQEVEKALLSHPAVQETAVIAVAHPRWQERPLACVVLRPELKDQTTREDLLAYLQPLLSRLYMPDDIVFLASLPRTSVGKYDKRALREQFKDYVLPGSSL